MSKTPLKKIIKSTLQSNFFQNSKIFTLQSNFFRSWKVFLDLHEWPFNLMKKAHNSIIA